MLQLSDMVSISAGIPECWSQFPRRRRRACTFLKHRSTHRQSPVALRSERRRNVSHLEASRIVRGCFPRSRFSLSDEELNWNCSKFVPSETFLLSPFRQASSQVVCELDSRHAETADWLTGRFCMVNNNPCLREYVAKTLNWRIQNMLPQIDHSGKD